jgi:hypothetical protein
VAWCGVDLVEPEEWQAFLFSLPRRSALFARSRRSLHIISPSGVGVCALKQHLPLSTANVSLAQLSFLFQNLKMIFDQSDVTG